MNLGLIFILLVVYQIKHFLADFPLQGPYMLKKFSPGWGFVPPLLAHVAVHASLTYAIVGTVTNNGLLAIQLAAIDAGIHFIMDRLKAGPKYLGQFKALTAGEYQTATAKAKTGNTLFWWSLGLDQMVHHLTHYYLIWRIISGS